MVYTLSGVQFPCPRSIYASSRSSFCDDRRSNGVSFSMKKEARSSGKIFAGKPSYDSDSPSLATTASEKLLVPGSHSDGSSSVADQVEAPNTVSDDPQTLEDVDAQTTQETQGTEEEDRASVSSISGDQSHAAHSTKMPESLDQKVNVKEREVGQRRIPTPGDGQKIYKIDPMLHSHHGHLDYRYGQYRRLREEIDKHEGGLEAFSRGYETFGFTRSATGITYREWAPAAKSASLIGDFNNWNPNANAMTQNEFGVWEIFLPNNPDGSPAIPHGSRVKVTCLCFVGVIMQMYNTSLSHLTAALRFFYIKS